MCTTDYWVVFGLLVCLPWPFICLPQSTDGHFLCQSAGHPGSCPRLESSVGVSLVDGTGTLKCPSSVSRELSHTLLTNTVVANEGLTSLDFKFVGAPRFRMTSGMAFGLTVSTGNPQIITVVSRGAR